jgi:penicillin-binding protein 1A
MPDFYNAPRNGIDMTDQPPQTQPEHRGAAPGSASAQWGRLTRYWPGWLRSIVVSLAALVGLAGAAVVAGMLLVTLALATAYPNLPEISGLTDYRPKLPMRIYSADGEMLGEFGEERRNFTPIGQMPKVMQDAVLAAEDARFFQHSGVDYKGMVRAALAQFAEARSQGASTITMQVARNFYLSTEKTFTRKIYEVLLAFKIEAMLTKEQILEVYMNQIFLGQRAYGFAAASEIYFGKPLQEITIAEAAMLAGLPKAPSAYNPIANPRRATVRQLHIIDRMLENGFITAEEREAARAQPLRYRGALSVATHAEHAAELARQLVFSHYGEDAYTRGLNVYLTMNSAEQTAAYRALRKGIMDFERRQVYRGPEAYVDLPAAPGDVDARVAEVLVEHADHDELRAAVVLEASRSKVVVALQNGEMLTITGDGLKPVNTGLKPGGDAKTQIRRGAVVRVMQTARGGWTLTQQPEVEGAFIAIDPSTGAVRALVGGFDYNKNKFNRVTQALRQPGSSFKPFIYSAALEQGFTPATVVNDAPLFFDAGATGSQPWEPKNYDGNFDGPMSLRRGLARSKNMISIRVVEKITPAFAQNWVAHFGFDEERHPAFLTIALGAGAVTPMQMAVGYSVFANGGHRIEPVLIQRITDARGRVLNETPLKAPDPSHRVIEARNAFVMTQLMQEVTRSGTAARAQALLKRNDIYGKTGTTNDSMDAWFAGYHKTVAAVVWMGYDTPRKLGDRETGGGLSLPVWIDYMTTALKGVPVSDMPVPEGVSQVAGEWFYSEYAHGGGVTSLGLEDALPIATTEEEKRGILDLFKR